jgi:hypothetical protein
MRLNDRCSAPLQRFDASVDVIDTHNATNY